MDSEIGWSPVVATRWIIGVSVALWSLLIGPEFPGEWDHGGITPKGPSQEVVSGGGRRIPMKQLITRPAVEVDRDAFLASYRRQARALLNPCLQSWKPSPGMATFTAVLHRKSGRINNLEAVGEQATLPECIGKISSTMDFSAVADSMTGDQAVLQWVAEW